MSTNQPRFRLVRELAEKALALPPEKRRAFVEARCPGDPDLAREVLELARDEVGGSFLDVPPRVSERPPPPESGT
ncbi:MAG: hypothetical protein AAGA20_23315 [Planctomycetota bacterium]